MISPEDGEFGVRLCSVFFYAGVRVDRSDSLRRRNNSRRVSLIVSAKREYHPMSLVEKFEPARKQIMIISLNRGSFAISEKRRLIVSSM